MFLACCRKRTPAPVDPRGYRAFFLWPHVAAPAWLRQAQTVYVLAGEIGRGRESRFEPLRATPKVPGPSLWLVVRVERLNWQDAIYDAILATLARWEAAGNRIEGLQIDFDAATRGLDRYATFLTQVRSRLPRGWKLSITGLMDWSAGGDPKPLRRLAAIVDDIVIQTYQGRHTIAGYERYLVSLGALSMPYRIGLVEGGDWLAPPALDTDPNFRGYVVFLLEPSDA